MEIQENENQVCISFTGRQSWHGEISAKLIQLRDIDRFFRYIYGVLHSLLHSRVNLSVLDRSSPHACHFETWQWWWSSEDIFHPCSATTLVCYRLYFAMDWFLTHVSWNMVTIAYKWSAIPAVFGQIRLTGTGIPCLWRAGFQETGFRYKYEVVLQFSV